MEPNAVIVLDPVNDAVIRESLKKNGGVDFIGDAAPSPSCC